MFLVVIAGAVQVEVDHKDFTTFWDDVWWAVVTVTTVGYGDIYPHTVAGRMVAIVLMLTGIGFLAVLTATVASATATGPRWRESGLSVMVFRASERGGTWHRSFTASRSIAARRTCSPM
jgi:hypothetical protein